VSGKSERVPGESKTQAGRVAACAILLALVEASALAEGPGESARVAPSRTFMIRGVGASLDLMKRLGAPPGSPGPTAMPLLHSPASLPVPRDLRTSSKPPRLLEALLTAPIAPSPEKSFVGLSDDNTFFPPDSQGAAGPSHLVSVLNRGFAIFRKDLGTIVFGPVSHQAFWSALGTKAGQPAAEPFDPRVLYDPFSRRFVVMADSGIDKAASWVLVGISKSSDPTQGFNIFAIDANVDNPGESADFPGLGVDEGHVYITNNMFTVSEPHTFTRSKFWVVDKASLIAGGPASTYEFVDPVGGGSWQPAQSFDDVPNNFLVDGDWQVPGTTQRFLRVLEFSYPAGPPVLTDLGFIQVADYGLDEALTTAPQLGCAENIDTGGSPLRSAVLRHGKIWTAHHVVDPVADGVGKREIAWYEFDPTQARLSDPISGPIQQGRVSDPVRWYYYPSIAVNANESIALGFSGSDSASYVGAYYTLHEPTDPPGTMQAVALLKAGQSPYVKKDLEKRNRWGDYSGTTVDPADDATFWTIQEYAGNEVAPGCPNPGTGRWGTWWGSFKDRQCMDADGDGFGSPGNPSCSGGRRDDCDDANPDVSPGATEVCGNTDFDCDGISGNAGADADGSGRVDGGDLWEWARRFGATLNSDPSSTFFLAYNPIVDFDNDGDIDGVDLQRLEMEFGKVPCP